MGKTQTYHVIGNRIRFICTACKTRRNSIVQRNIRKKNIRCSACGEVTKCILDRRARRREQHSGKIIMITQGGRNLDVFLHDISASGVGLDIPIKALRSRKITAGRRVRFKCSWNPHLFNNGNFVISNINGQRIGVQKIGLG